MWAKRMRSKCKRMSLVVLCGFSVHCTRHFIEKSAHLHLRRWLHHHRLALLHHHRLALRHHHRLALHHHRLALLRHRDRVGDRLPRSHFNSGCGLCTDQIYSLLLVHDGTAINLLRPMALL